MKFKTTIILAAVFLVLLAFVLFFEPKKKSEGAKEEKLVALASGDVQKIVLKKTDETISFQKDDKGEWLITGPLQAKADSSEVTRLTEDFSDLRIERVVEPEAKDLTKYEIPKTEVTLWYKNQTQPVKILIGMENPLDNTFFAKKEDDKRIVLISSSFKSLLEKKTFDFRQKDVFKFEIGDVKAIRLRAKDIQWEAAKKDEEWFFEKPVAALAKKSKVEDVLNSLSNMKVKEFVSEAKKPEDVEKLKLKTPEYEVSLSLAAKNQELVFALHKEGDKIYATTSLSSRIITIEEQVLKDLEKKTEDLREKQVVTFNSWQAKKLFLRKGDTSLTVVKDKDDKWHFESAAKEEADRSKTESFIRKIESLEASEFIDKPSGLKDYGLDTPQADVKIWIQEDEKKEKEYQILVGSEDKEKKQVVVHNPKLEYLFRVDAAFLGEFPKDAKDWKAPVKEEKKK